MSKEEKDVLKDMAECLNYLLRKDGREDAWELIYKLEYSLEEMEQHDE